MNDLPKNTRLGKLEYLEIYDQYDSQPCLFSCRNQNGQIYLAVWVDENDDGDRWLYTAISRTRLKWLREKVIDIKSVFTQAASGFVYDVKTDNAGVSNAKMLSCSVLTDDLLPVAGEFLKYN
jgi:hypothetical protein